MRRARATISSPAAVSDTLLGRALDELHAEVVLELLELRRERGLAHEAALGGAAEVALSATATR